MDYKLGLTMVNVMDPMTQIRVPITGNLFYLVVMAMLVATGGLHAFIRTFFYSYEVLPIGAAWIVGNIGMAWYTLMLLAEFMVIAVKIAMPVMGSMMVIDVALGILVKGVPQMNIFVVGMPIKLLLGLILLFSVVTPTLGMIYDYIYNTAHNALMEIIWGMLPQ
jgi:flagellar biosynthetic protein FliR